MKNLKITYYLDNTAGFVGMEKINLFFSHPNGNIEKKTQGNCTTEC